MRNRFFLLTFFITGLVIFASTAPVLAASPYFLVWHETDATILEGRSVYDNVKFCRIYCDITDEASKKGGSLTISDLSASYGTWKEFGQNKSAASKVSGETKKFRLIYDEGEGGHVPANDDGVKMIFWGEADKGFSEKEFSFAITGKSPVKGSLPLIRSSEEQMKSFVPYIELVVDPLDRVTEVNWRFVDPTNVGAALKKGMDAGSANVGKIFRLRFEDSDGKRIGFANLQKSFANDEELAGVAKLEKAVNFVDLDLIKILFEEDNRTSKSRVHYEWHFYVK